MDDNAVRQLILVIENHVSQAGFGEEGLRSAQSRGWLDVNGRVTDEGRRLFLAVSSQVGTRSAMRDLV